MSVLIFTLRGKFVSALFQGEISGTFCVLVWQSQAENKCFVRILLQYIVRFLALTFKLYWKKTYLNVAHIPGNGT